MAKKSPRDQTTATTSDIEEPHIAEPSHSGQRSAVDSVATMEMWSAPLPPPEALLAYDKAMPGGAERIMNQFEANGRHRRKAETAHMRIRWFGLFFGFLLASGIIGIGALAVTLDKGPAIPIASMLLIAAGIWRASIR